MFATGAYRPDTKHGLLHLGVLPLQPGAEVEHWLLNPERDYPKAVTEASGIGRDRSRQHPTWGEAAATIQPVLAGFDVLLIMDRAGEPSAERHWLEQCVLAGLERPPVCIGLDELLAFFLPGEELDDADELLRTFVVRDKAASEQLGYAKRNADGRVPQLPFVLYAMRRALRRVLASLLRPEGTGPQQWLPIFSLLDSVVRRAPRQRTSRAYRLLHTLARQPRCCDEATPAPTDQPLSIPPALPAWPSSEHVETLVFNYLARWRDRPDDATAPELGLGDVSEKQVADAFEELGKRLAGAGRDSKDKLQTRPQQVEYAQFVAQSIGGRGAYAIEAGTGTGKTYGYLVPALEYLRHAPSALVVVATSTKNLQEQMRRGELPRLLREPDGRRNPRYQAIRTATLKGKNCYLCAMALAQAYDDCFQLSADWAEGLAWLYLLLRLRDTEGEIEGVARPLNAHPQLGPFLRGLVRRVAADRACRHAPLPGRKPCVYPAHRARAEQAHLLIVNHHKLALLPLKVVERATVCVIDEADRFPDNFRSALASSLDARELQEELFEPLLDGSRLPSRRPTANSKPQDEARTERRAVPFLPELDERLYEVQEQLWREVPAAEQPGPDEASRAAYELVEEARLAELGSQAALLEEVALLMLETPVAADTRQSADAAWQLLAIESAPFRRRQALRTAARAVAASYEPLRESQLLLTHLSSQFQSRGGRLAPLPFPAGGTHWQDNLRVAEHGRPPIFRPFHQELVAALQPLQPPLADASHQLGCLRRHLVQALNISLSSGEAADEDAPDVESSGSYDERLYRRAERFAELAQSQAEILVRLLSEFPCRGYVPVVERDPVAGPLSWQLGRQPYELWSYLGATPDPATGHPLVREPDEADEAFQARWLAARAALQRLSREPDKPLLEQFRSVIFTSATLYVQGTLQYFRQQLDLRVPFAGEQRIRPLFDYNNERGEQVLAGIPTYLPQFRAGARPDEKRAWCEIQLRTLLPLLVALEGRTLVLFTSNEEMHLAADWLRERLAAHDIELLVQNGASQWEIRRFRQLEQSVLLGVDRMWTGVDFAGPTLSQVIVWRLPFPSLGEPLISHRKRYEPDEVFWGQFYRPAARLKLRQGFGRLVRRQRDRGAFVVLDARAATGFYANVLDELEVEAFHRFGTPTALFEQTAGPLLKLLELGADFHRRELSVSRLLELSQ
ncbi:hypothetical protein Hsw_PA0202 (plasmid) [Hymenobacter swuensis DY53]|uniref:Helicase ATP-binding domain-containing protein n=1 Tax=Hymenobacter swuensis DY53 TaxID=1227739 RepID=W8F142_9BACT|nr:hypothetical protein Hsw_PA0202 [Hymenobacter swuensis DY53]